MDAPPLVPDRLYTRKETAAILRITVNSLSKMHRFGRIDLPWVQVSGAVRYRGQDIIDFIERSVTTKTRVDGRALRHRRSP